jgi:hypothetical protein
VNFPRAIDQTGRDFRSTNIDANDNVVLHHLGAVWGDPLYARIAIFSQAVRHIKTTEYYTTISISGGQPGTLRTAGTAVLCPYKIRSLRMLGTHGISRGRLPARPPPG